MKITETRKQIIELLGEFEGRVSDVYEGDIVLFRDKHGLEKYGMVLKQERIFKNRILTVQGFFKKGGSFITNIATHNELIRDFGQYDITAIIDFIRGKGVTTQYDNDINEFYLFLGTQYHSYPNKPLHLYTEQEEENLLTLLKQLGKQ